MNQKTVAFRMVKGMVVFDIPNFISEKHEARLTHTSADQFSYNFSDQIEDYITFWNDDSEEEDMKRKIKYNPEFRELLQEFSADEHYLKKIDDIKSSMLGAAFDIEHKDGEQSVFYTTFNFSYLGIEPMWGNKHRYTCVPAIIGFKQEPSFPQLYLEDL